MRYAIVIERGPASFGAYVPDLPGCVAVAKTRPEAERLIKEAIAFHLEALKRDGEPIPKPAAKVEYLDVPIPA